jgi:hypothetical protein
MARRPLLSRETRLTPPIILLSHHLKLMRRHSTSTHIAPLFATIGKRHQPVNIDLWHFAFRDKDLGQVKAEGKQEKSAAYSILCRQSVKSCH